MNTIIPHPHWVVVGIWDNVAKQPTQGAVARGCKAQVFKSCLLVSPTWIESGICLLPAACLWECCFTCLSLSLWVCGMMMVDHLLYSCLWRSDEVMWRVSCPAPRVMANPMKLNATGRGRAHAVCQGQGWRQPDSGGHCCLQKGLSRLHWSKVEWGRSAHLLSGLDLWLRAAWPERPAEHSVVRTSAQSSADLKDGLLGGCQKQGESLRDSPWTRRGRITTSPLR